MISQPITKLSKPTITSLFAILCCCQWLLALAALGQEQLLFANSNQPAIISTSANNQQQQQQHLYRMSDQSNSNINRNNLPGHYEFEVAPKMEPPSVRRPPYQQSAQLCPGTDPFSGFSPRDTLCGDLNQGRVPINPLGQSILDQSYPFELIKNKTLQFLARALPVLKLEYETIPKVARFVQQQQQQQQHQQQQPQHLLNPTHHQSPLSSEHLNHLNARLATTFNGLTQEELQAALEGFPFSPSSNGASGVSLKRRRRKRSPRQPSLGQGSSSVVSGILTPSQMISVGSSSSIEPIAAAELSPNATLVISSAHSGRILDSRTRFSSPISIISPNKNNNSNTTYQYQSRFGNSGNLLDLGNGVITKDGYKSIGATKSSLPAASASASSSSSSSSKLTSNNWPPQTEQQEQQQTNKQLRANTTTNNAAANATPMGAAKKDNHAIKSTSSTSTTTTTTTPPSASLTPKKEDRRQAAISFDDEIGQDNGSNVENGDLATSHSYSGLTMVAAPAPPPESARSSSGANSNAAAEHSGSRPQTINSAQSQLHPQQPDVLAKRTSSGRLPCNDAGNGFTSALCQAASALIEGEKVPTWLQLAKHVGNAYSAGNSDNAASSTNLIWSLLSGIAQESSPKSSSSSLTQTKNNFFNLLAPITNLLTGSGGGGNMQASSKSESSKADPMQASESSSSHVSTVAPKHNNNNHAPSALSSLSSSTLTRLALAGWATNAIASLVEYFVPSVFQSVNSRSFAKRKKPFDPLETFVDTPASLAASASSKATSSSNLMGLSKQPPTPCPSVEEYISPTFARNYQGAWKYVVQIPHEGYFTQTIQRTSCVRQKCEFTNGVCHESPRWVSLLVAEIYYPNTVYAAATPTTTTTLNANQLVDQQQQLSAFQQASAASTNAAQQMLATSSNPQIQAHQSAKGHPALQATDSLSNYNMNLNNAFVSAAHELGLDPNNVANMQQLANAYNYQLAQRYGSQQVAAESRASHAYAVPQQQQQSQYVSNIAYDQQQQQQPLQSINYNEYITALAAETLRQNPNMNINTLINSLQLQKRKKRDLGPQQQQQQQTSTRRSSNPINQHHHHHQLQSRISSNNVDAIQSLNDIATMGSPMAAANNIAQMNSFVKMTDPQTQQQASTSSSTQAHQQQQISSPSPPMTSDQSSPANQAASNNDNQECDGHDKIGCYVVRVYYDWFLVNGSCKCWKTTSGSQGSSSKDSTSSSGNSFLRRIFTG